MAASKNGSVLTAVAEKPKREKKDRTTREHIDVLLNRAYRVQRELPTLEERQLWMTDVVQPLLTAWDAAKVRSIATVDADESDAA